MVNRRQPVAERSITLEAVIGKVKTDYFVTYPKNGYDEVITKDTPITVSLSDWNSQTPPKKGQLVMLSNIQQFEHGWRARSAVSVELRAPQKKKRGARHE
jgi:hypothetical protein